MANPEAALNKLEKLLSVVEDSVTKKELEEAVLVLVRYVKAINERTTEDFKDAKRVLDISLKKLQDSTDRSLTDLKKQVGGAFVGDIVSRMQREHAEHMSLIEKRVASIRNGDKGDKGDSIKGEPGKNGSPDTPQEIIDKLESVPEKDKLVIEAIKGLREELDDLRKRFRSGMSGPVYSGGGPGTGGGKVVKVYDLTPQLNGVLKTFALPAFWRVHTVDLSSFPNTLRPTVEFTTDGNAMTITFTSEVNAATSLATGQTCIVTYSE